jgi:phage terminase Nu1 subunit (DNA packaging protein)
MELQLVSVVGFARLKGVSHTAVQLAIKSGRLVNSISRDEKGKIRINPILAAAEWEANTKHEKRKHGNDVRRADPAIIEKTQKLVKVKPFIKPKDDGEESGGVVSMSEATRRKELAQAELAELKLATEKGRLVDREEVKRDAFKIGRQVRDRLIGIPDRVSAEVAGLTDPFKVHDILSVEIRNALEALIAENDAP